MGGIASFMNMALVRSVPLYPLTQREVKFDTTTMATFKLRVSCSPPLSYSCSFLACWNSPSWAIGIN
jgi:hypothetical protein